MTAAGRETALLHPPSRRRDFGHSGLHSAHQRLPFLLNQACATTCYAAVHLCGAINPYAMQEYGDLARQGDLCPLQASPLGDIHSPALGRFGVWLTTWHPTTPFDQQ